MDQSMHGPSHKEPVIGVVGPCGAGKSTLIAGLRRHGVDGRHIAQEHSYVPRMWQRIVNPDLLIYLDASFATCTARRRLTWTEADYVEQLRRLEHAREHAHVVIETDSIPAGEVLARAIEFLAAHGLSLHKQT